MMILAVDDDVDDEFTDQRPVEEDFDSTFLDRFMPEFAQDDRESVLIDLFRIPVTQLVEDFVERTDDRSRELA